MTFQRPKGFMGGKPRDWIDRNMPVCPFCFSRAPLWEMRMRFQKWGWTLYDFRCPLCLGTLSIAMEIVAPSGTSNWPLRAPSNKLRIESVGKSVSTLKVGSEYSLDELRRASETNA